jgi:hypothetical protein
MHAVKELSRVRGEVGNQVCGQCNKGSTKNTSIGITERGFFVWFLAQYL